MKNILNFKALIIYVFIVSVNASKLKNEFDPFNPVGSALSNLNPLKAIGGLFKGVETDASDAIQNILNTLLPKEQDINPKFKLDTMMSNQEEIKNKLPDLKADVSTIENLVNQLTVGASINAAKGLSIDQGVLKPDMSGPSEQLLKLKTPEKNKEKNMLKGKNFLVELTKPSQIVSDYTAPIIVIQAPETTPQELLKISDIIQCQGGSNWITQHEHMIRMKEYKKVDAKNKQQIKDEINTINNQLNDKDDQMTQLRNKLRALEMELLQRPSDVTAMEIKLINQQMIYLADEIVVLNDSLDKYERHIK